MADRDEHPRDVRHAGLSRDGEIPALVGHRHLCGAGEFGFAGQLGILPALRVRCSERVKVILAGSSLSPAMITWNTC
jgi:hypothetical protein